MANETWTIMIYMAGDNNLSDDMIKGLLGMENPFGNRKDISLLARFDSGEPTIQTVYVDFTGEIKFNRSKEPVQTVIRPINEERTNLASIRKFVEFAYQEHPADNYVLIFSGHGDGFLNTHFMRDEDPFSYITIRGLRNILHEICRDVLGKDQLKILGFDSCVMNTLEVAHEMRNVAEVFVSSQGYVPSAGWDYQNITKRLREFTDPLDKFNIAEIFVNSFADINEEFAKFGLRSVDIASLELDKVTPVSKEVNSLAGVLEEALKDETVKREVKQLILFSHFECQTYLFDQSIDLKDFCEILQKECKINNNTKLSKIIIACDRVIKAIDKFVLARRCTGPDYQYSNGISIFFPWSNVSYRTMTRERYRTLEFPLGTDVPFPPEGKPSLEVQDDNTHETGSLVADAKSAWVSLLDYYLLDTMRLGRHKTPQETTHPAFLFNALSTNIPVNDSGFLKINPFFTNFKSKSTEVKVDPYSGRPRGSAGSLFEYFRKTKNFPWSKQTWEIDNSK